MSLNTQLLDEQNIEIIYTTFSAHDWPKMKKLFQQLIQESKAACINVWSGQVSIYLWENQLQEDQEFYAFIKTNSVNLKYVVDFLKNHHPYSAPAIIHFKATSFHPTYNQWFQETLEWRS